VETLTASVAMPTVAKGRVRAEEVPRRRVRIKIPPGWENNQYFWNDCNHLNIHTQSPSLMKVNSGGGFKLQESYTNISISWFSELPNHLNHQKVFKLFGPEAARDMKCSFLVVSQQKNKKTPQTSQKNSEGR